MDNKSKKLLLIFLFLLLSAVIYLWFKYLVNDNFEIEMGEDLQEVEILSE